MKSAILRQWNPQMVKSPLLRILKARSCDYFMVCVEYNPSKILQGVCDVLQLPNNETVQTMARIGIGWLVVGLNSIFVNTKTLDAGTIVKLLNIQLTKKYYKRK